MKRVAVFDNIKYFLIILVVYGHLKNIGCGVPWLIYKIIYSFHIPLFVFISGYFTKKDDLKFTNALLNLFFLYVIFSLFSLFDNMFVYHKPAVTSIFRTPFALWYLLCLIYWKSIIHFSPVKLLKSWWFLIAICVLSVTPLFIFLDYFSFARCLSFFPYFLLGWLGREYNWIKKLDGIITPPHQHIGFFIVIVMISCVCCYLATKIPVELYWGLNPVELPVIIILGCKGLIWAFSIVNSLAVYLLMPKKRGIGEGSYTLFYYLYHTILLYPFFDLAVKHIPNTPLMSIAVLICAMLLLFLMRKISILNQMLTVGRGKD